MCPHRFDTLSSGVSVQDWRTVLIADSGARPAVASWPHPQTCCQTPWGLRHWYRSPFQPCIGAGAAAASGICAARLVLFRHCCFAGREDRAGGSVCQIHSVESVGFGAGLMDSGDCLGHTLTGRSAVAANESRTASKTQPNVLLSLPRCSFVAASFSLFLRCCCLQQ